MSIQIIRSIDGLVYALIAAFVTIAHPAIGRDALGNPLLVCVAPVMLVGALCFLLPMEFHEIHRWKPLILKLRFLGSALFLLSPFIVWWVNIPDNSYLFGKMLSFRIIFLSFISSNFDGTFSRNHRTRGSMKYQCAKPGRYR